MEKYKPLLIDDNNRRKGGYTYIKGEGLRKTDSIPKTGEVPALIASTVFEGGCTAKALHLLGFANTYSETVESLNACKCIHFGMPPTVRSNMKVLEYPTLAGMPKLFTQL